MTHPDVDEKEDLVVPFRERVKHREKRSDDSGKILSTGRRHINEPHSLVFGNAHLRRERSLPAVNGDVVPHLDETRRDFTEACLESREMKLWHRHAVQPKHSDAERLRGACASAHSLAGEVTELAL